MPGWGIEDDAADTGDGRPPERELVPEGDHDLQIRQVIEDEGRVEIRLAHDDRRYGWVFAKLPRDAGWAKRILSTLRTSLDMSREEWQSTPATDLVGRRVRARLYHRATSGRTFVNVGDFLPGAVETATAAPAVERAVAPPAARAAVKRTPTKQADAVGHDPDDIPF